MSSSGALYKSQFTSVKPFELILLFLTASFSRHEHLAEVWQDEKGNEEKDVTTEIYRGVNLKPLVVSEEAEWHQRVSHKEPVN